MRIVGIDGGLAHMGLADFDVTKWGQTYKGGKVLETVPTAKKHGVRKGDDNMRRAREITKGLIAFLDARENPPVICYEAQSFGMRGQIAARQAATAFGIIAAIAQARSIAILCATPGDVKAAMCPGVKKASKDDVIRAVEERYSVTFASIAKHANWEHLADACGVVAACADDELVLAMLRVESAA